VNVYSAIVQDCKVHRTPKIENKIVVYSAIVKFTTVKLRATL